MLKYFGFYLSFISFFAAGVATAASDPKPVYKKAGDLPFYLMSDASGGRILVKVEKSPHLYLWNPNGTFEALYAPTQSASISSNSIRYAFSPNGELLIVKDDHREVNGLPGRLTFFDLTQDKIKGFSLEESRILSSYPLVSPDRSRMLLFGVNRPWDGKSAWTLSMSELFWDAERKMTQQSGYYLESLPKIDFGNRVTSGTFSPDGTKAALVLRPGPNIPSRRVYDEDEEDEDFADWDSDGGYGGYYAYGGGKKDNSDKSIQILDVATGESQERVVGQKVETISWASEDTMIFKTAGSYAGNSSLLKYTLSTNQSQLITSERVEYDQVSPDGEWLLYSPAALGRARPRVFELRHIASNRKFEFGGASLGTFSMHGKKVLFTLADEKSPKPFIEIQLDQYVDKDGGTFTDLSKEAAKSAYGNRIPVWEIPEDGKVVNAIFSTEVDLVSPLQRGLSLRLGLKNNTAEFFDLKNESALEMECTIEDDAGTVYGRGMSHSPRANPYNSYGGYGGYGVDRTPSQPYFEPGQRREIMCFVFFGSQQALPASKNLKVKYRFKKWDKDFGGEVAVP